MNRFGNAIPPSEAVEWQWPKPVKLWESAAWLAWYAIGAAAGWAYWTGALDGDFWRSATLAFAIPAAMSVSGRLLKFVGILLWGRRWVAVTAQRIVLTTGRILPRYKTVYRDTVHSAALYEGDGTLILHGRDGEELLRFAWWDDERQTELLALLDRPTAVWSKRKPSDAARAVGRKALSVTLPFWGLLAIGVVVLAGLDGIVAAADWSFLYVAGVITTPGAIAASVVGGGAMLFAVGVIQAIMQDHLSVLIAVRTATPEILRELICKAGDPLWDGTPRDPRKADRISDIFTDLNKFAKARGAQPVEPIPLEPEWRDFKAQVEADT